jgi:hypothetical protein
LVGIVISDSLRENNASIPTTLRLSPDYTSATINVTIGRLRGEAEFLLYENRENTVIFSR